MGSRHEIRAGKLRTTLTAFEGEVERNGFARLAIAPDHLRAVMQLPVLHRDPFDHLLIAQAIVEDMTMLSADRWFGDYPVRLV